MNGRSDVHYAFKNAIEALVTRPGSNIDRLGYALYELRTIKEQDFENRIDVTCLKVIQVARDRMNLGDMGSVDEHEVRKNIWAIYDRCAPKKF